MKKTLLIMTMAGLPVFAQAKKAAKPAKKEAVPAQVAPAPQAENTEPTQPAAKAEKNWTLGGYILANIPSGPIVDNRQNIDKGGPSIGAHGLFNFSDFSLGGGLAVLPIYAENTGANPVSARFIAYDILFRYRLAGAYIGAIAGYAMGISGTESQQVGTLSHGISYGASLGYVINVGSIGIHLGCDLRQITYWIPKADGGASSATSDILNITPKIGVDFTF